MFSVSEDSSTEKTTESVNSDSCKTVESITDDDARNAKELIVGAESGDKKQCINKDSDTVNKVTLKSHFFSDS